MKKKITFIGAGNVATHLAKQLYANGHTILQVYSRTDISANTLASEVNARHTTSIENVSGEADIYIFSVKDSVLEDLIKQLPTNQGLWIHTSGSMPMNVFDGQVKNYGVFYPLQTFSKNRAVDWKDIPLFIEASNENSYEQIEKLAKSLSTKTYPLSSEKRKYLHISGVFACNFVNHMYELGGKMIEEAGLPFEVLLPLIDETCRKIHSSSPHEAQTGPAIRYDENVIDKHLKMLDNPTMKEIYKLLSESIHKSHL